MHTRFPSPQGLLQLSLEEQLSDLVDRDGLERPAGSVAPQHRRGRAIPHDAEEGCIDANTLGCRSHVRVMWGHVGPCGVMWGTMGGSYRDMWDNVWYHGRFTSHGKDMRGQMEQG